MTSFKMKTTLAALLLAGSMVSGRLRRNAQDRRRSGASRAAAPHGALRSSAAPRSLIDEVNKAGGLKVGDKTYNIELMMYDDQYTGQGGKTAAERLVFQDKVKFIVGPIGSNPVLSTMEVTTPQKVLLMSNGYTPKILQNDHKASYNFRFTLTNIEFAPSMMKWVKDNLKLKKVGILVPNDAIGQSVAPPLVKLYKESGIETVVDYYERGSKEFSPLITRLMAAGIDGFDINFNAPGEAGLMVKQARQIGFDKTILQMGGTVRPRDHRGRRQARRGLHLLRDGRLRCTGGACPSSRPMRRSTARAS